MGHGRDGAARKGAARFLKGHGHRHGQPGVLLGGQQGGLGFIKVPHGFDDDQVRSCLYARLHRLGKKAIGFLEGEGAQGLQHGPQRPQVQGHLDGSILAGRFG